MSFIIGSSSSTNLEGVQSVSITQTPSIQYQYILGSTTPYFKLINTQLQISITNYAGVGRGFTLNLDPSDTCVDSPTVNFTFSPGFCTGSNLGNISKELWVTSYSYNKDIEGVGTQSWTLVDKPVIGVQGITGNFPSPIMLRGQSTGQAVNKSITGVIFGSTTIEGRNTQVTAGFPGIGTDEITEFGEVASIQNALFFAPGQKGNASVTIPYTPTYLGDT